MRAPLVRLLAVLVAGISMAVLSPQVAVAAPPTTSDPSIGNDVSWPQCGKRLPSSTGFAIIGLNGGLANDWNPCLSDQLAWARRAVPAGSAGTVALYVNTANAAELATWWPSGNSTRNGTSVEPGSVNPYGSCPGTHPDGSPDPYGPACAFVYGYSFAVEDVRHLEEVHREAATDYRWWLDVETTNTWQQDRDANRAVLEGMTAYFEELGLDVGIYSTGSQWGAIAGTTTSDSNLHSLPSWLAGSSSERDARSDCSLPPLTGGGDVAMTQYVAKQLDYNILC